MEEESRWLEEIDKAEHSLGSFPDDYSSNCVLCLQKEGGNFAFRQASWELDCEAPWKCVPTVTKHGHVRMRKMQPVKTGQYCYYHKKREEGKIDDSHWNEVGRAR